VVSSHACGSLTDRVLDAAIGASATVAVLPCCHEMGGRDAGPLAGWVDGALAIDVARAMRLASLRISRPHTDDSASDRSQEPAIDRDAVGRTVAALLGPHLSAPPDFRRFDIGAMSSHDIRACPMSTFPISKITRQRHPTTPNTRQRPHRDITRNRC
jgi:hypothetical protein